MSHFVKLFAPVLILSRPNPGNLINFAFVLEICNMAETEQENIFLFVPNLIGYGRVILAIMSFWFMPTNYVAAGWCYIISGLLDAFDGHAARTFNQSTKFGAMLDQLTDRCATMALLATLCTFYPSYTFFFQMSMVIDISCHWIHLHTSLLQVCNPFLFVLSNSK